MFPALSLSKVLQLILVGGGGLSPCRNQSRTKREPWLFCGEATIPFGNQNVLPTGCCCFSSSRTEARPAPFPALCGQFFEFIFLYQGNLSKKWYLTFPAHFLPPAGEGGALDSRAVGDQMRLFLLFWKKWHQRFVHSTRPKRILGVSLQDSLLQPGAFRACWTANPLLPRQQGSPQVRVKESRGQP